MTEKDENLVPEIPPYGGVTDGSVMCGRCREWITGCAMCAGETRMLVRSPAEREKMWGRK